jgi:uncharacterized membrane protein
MRYSILILILFFAVGLRCYNIEGVTLAGDEKFTLLGYNGICMGGKNQAHIYEQPYFTPKEFWSDIHIQSYFDAVAISDIGAHIPYNLLLNGWSTVFGINDWQLRLFSILMGLLTVFFLYKLVLENTKNQLLSYIVCGLFAIEPLMLALNRMIRSYSLSLLLTVLATYLFFEIINNRHRKIDYVWYALIVATSLLTHYLNFLVILVHGLIVLFFVRDFKKWFALGLSVGFGGLVLVWWLTAGGGIYTFKFLEDKNALHRKMAEMPLSQNPMAGMVDRPTAENLAKRFYELASDQFITTNNLWNHLVGNKNWVVVLAITLFSILVSLFSKHKYRYVAIYVVLGTGLAVISINRFHFFVLICNALLLFYLLKAYWQNRQSVFNSFYVFCLLICVLPYLYLAFDALSNGHTSSLTQRYASFSMPYALVLVALLVSQIKDLPKPAAIPIAVGMLIQLFLVLQIDWKVLNDMYPKYTYYGKSKIKNPYYSTAQKIIENYSKGDTVVYPSYNKNVYSSVLEDKRPIGVLDAQFMNVYLPKNATYIQRIDRNEPNKVILKKANGSQQVLFDFEGQKYRY